MTRDRGIATTRDGRMLHYRERTGPAGPTVVFEAGMGASGVTWALVQRATAARAVVYDRSGLGASAPDRQPRTLRRLADDLGDLLDHLGAGPYVLVGHSWGGPVVRVAAAAHPARVSGMVLVDPTDEACDDYFSPAARRQERLGRALLPPLARTGILTLLAGRMTTPLPPEDRAEARAAQSSPAAVRTTLAEMASLTEDLMALRENPVDLGDIPVTVVSGTRGRRRRASLLAAHAHRAGRSPHGRHVLAHRSAHLVPLTEPEVVAREIDRLL